MRVCFPSIYSVAGGSNRSAILLSKHFNADSVETFFIFPSEGQAAHLARDAGSNTIMVPMNSYVEKKFNGYGAQGFIKRSMTTILLLPYIIQAFKVLREYRFDIVHTNDLASTLIWGLAAKVAGIPTVWHVRQHKSSRILDKIRLFATSQLILVSEFNRKKFRKNDIRKKNPVIIYNGVELDCFTSSPNSQNTDEFTIGYVGHLVPRKRPDLFIEIGAEIAKRIPCKLLIVGNAPWNPDYEQYLRHRSEELGVSSRTKFLGYREDVPDLMRRMDLLLFTSTPEGEAFPRVIIEAMACGLVIVASKSAGVPEAITNGETGLIVESNDPSDFVNAIERVYRDPTKMNSMREASLKKVREKFDAKKVADQVYRVYLYVLGC